jgi:hypothetical protein
MPEIWQKQLHIFKREIEPYLRMSENERPEFFKKLTKTKDDKLFFYVHTMFFKKLLYKDWSETFFQAGKPSGYFFQEHSNWYLKGDLTDKRAKDYHYGQVMEFLEGIDPRFIMYDNTGKPLQFNGIVTKPIVMV